MAEAPAPPSRRVRTPTVLQMEWVECGAAALAMVLAHHGRWVPLEELRVACGVSRDGSNALNMIKAARNYGLEGKGRRAPVEEALAAPMPAIVLWNYNHFLVLEGMARGKVHVNDPASGPRAMTREDFDRGYSRILIKFERTTSFQPAGRAPSVLPALARRLHDSGAPLALVFAVSLMLVVPGLLTAGLLKAFVDEVLIRGATTWLLPIVIGFAATAALSGSLTGLQQRYLRKIQLKLSVSMASGLFWHVMRLPAVFFSQRQPGDIVVRLQSCNRVAQLLSGRLSTTLVEVLVVVLFAAAMMLINAELAAVVLLLAALNGALIAAVQRKRSDLSAEQMRIQAKVVATAMGGIQAIETIKATGSEQDFFARWAGHHARFVNARQRLGGIAAGLDAVPDLLGRLMLIATLGLGGYLIIAGRMSIGDLIAFQALLGRFSGPIQSLVNLSGDLQEMGAALGRIDDAQRYPTDPTLAPASVPAGEQHRLSGRVALRNVSFAYGPLDPPVLRDINLTLEPGARVALVGASGSGKSTLAKLLIGLYQPSDGQILFDGRLRSEIPRAVLTHSLAAVDQDVVLFEGTVRDNLTLWDSSVPDEVMRRAAHDALIDEVISARAGGYDSPVLEAGSNFSGGQRQRLEIARALMREPSILVLDEATAALDPLTEKAIDDNLRRRGCTCIIVAHRLSTIRDADLIVVLDKGEIVERGDHQTLIALGGSYARLVADA